MTGTMQTDAIVIGAGIAGAGVAALLAERMKVVLLEREDFPGRHSTGRSAALFSQIYGGPVVRALTQASREFLFAPPQGFADVALTRPRGFMMVAGPTQLDALNAFAAQTDIAQLVAPVSAAEVARKCPILRPEAACGAIFEADAHDLEVDALHQGYLRLLRARGGALITDCNIKALVRGSDCWRAWCNETCYEAPLIINAAGAWADDVAAIAGVRTIGLEPKRRTAVLVDAPVGVDVGAWPLIMDVDEQCYFKPEGGRLLLSPADETPSPPCDAQPEQMDVAIAIDSVQKIARLDVKRVVRAWAGLRSFVRDREPVVGFDSEAPGFFWVAGQGGYGIQTAPALSRAAVALLQQEPLPADLVALGVNEAKLAPARLGALETSAASQSQRR